VFVLANDELWGAAIVVFTDIFFLESFWSLIELNQVSPLVIQIQYIGIISQFTLNIHVFAALTPKLTPIAGYNF